MTIHSANNIAMPIITRIPIASDGKINSSRFANIPARPITAYTEPAICQDLLFKNRLFTHNLFICKFAP